MIVQQQNLKQISANTRTRFKPKIYSPLKTGKTLAKAVNPSISAADKLRELLKGADSV